MFNPKSCMRPAHVTALGLAAGTLLTLSACGAGSHSAASSASSSPGPSAPASTGTAAPATRVTIRAADVSGFGKVMVDGSGQTLYILTSERGGKLTCTDANGCTKVWPDTELPDGVTAATAGPGARASLLGTVKDAKGSLYLTYGGWPLYTFSGDDRAGQAHGEGITSFGGTWYVVGASGQPVTSSSSSSSSSGSAGGGY